MRNRILNAPRSLRRELKKQKKELKIMQTYKASLDASIEKNNEDQKKSAAELKALHQQRVDIKTSTAKLIEGIRASVNPDKKGEIENG